MAEKGASLIVQDFKNELVEVINKYNMPAIIKQSFVEDINNKLIKAAEYELQKEEQEYKEALEQEDEEKRTEEGGDEECQKEQED